MMTRIIYAFPLSIPMKIRGRVVWFREGLKIEDLDTILVAKEQHIGMLKYIHSILGIIVQYGGITSHLAIVGRELEIPVYRYERADTLKEGEYIEVVPNISGVALSSRGCLRIVSPSPDKAVYKLWDTIADLDSIVEKYGGSLEITSDVEIRTKGDLYVAIICYKVHKLNNIINNIIERVDEFKQEEGVGASLLCSDITDYMFTLLYRKVGSKAYSLIRGIKPYWLEADDRYIRYRFGNVELPVIDYQVQEIKIEDVPDDAKRLAEAIKYCVKKYEDKNRKTFGVKKVRGRGLGLK